MLFQVFIIIESSSSPNTLAFTLNNNSFFKQYDYFQLITFFEYQQTAIAFKIDQIIKEATHALLHHLCIGNPLIRSVHFGVRLRDCLIDQSIRAGQTTNKHKNN